MYVDRRVLVVEWRRSGAVQLMVVVPANCRPQPLHLLIVWMGHAVSSACEPTQSATRPHLYRLLRPASPCAACSQAVAETQKLPCACRLQKELQLCEA